VQLSSLLSAAAFERCLHDSTGGLPGLQSTLALHYNRGICLAADMQGPAVRFTLLWVLVACALPVMFPASFFAWRDHRTQEYLILRLSAPRLHRAGRLSFMPSLYADGKQKNTCDVDYLRLSTTLLRVRLPEIRVVGA
jgi:hypothetical protein